MKRLFRIKKEYISRLEMSMGDLFHSRKFFGLILIGLFSVFFILFFYKSLLSMAKTPFNEFDEAHRAENAKQMKDYKSYLVPLTGSDFDREFKFREQFRDEPVTFLYYHLERPPLVYLSMVASISVFGSIEWAYRLPSFILGMLVIVFFIFFSTKLADRKNIDALFVGLLCLITSADLWLSSQYAQLDTGLTVFLFLALLSLIYYCEKKIKIYLYLSGFGLGLAILSKGQPAIIFLLPLAYLLVTKKLKLWDFLKLSLATAITISPWIAYSSWKFGLINVITVFISFALSSTRDEVYHLAPVFWYIRWWWVTLRPGWTLFICLFLIDVFTKKLDWKKTALLFFVLGGLVTFSIPHNKLWWYVLPLVPPMCFYIYLSSLDLLKKKNLLLNISLILVVASRPPVMEFSNKWSMFYGVLLTVISLCILGLFNIDYKTHRLKGAFKQLFSLRGVFLFSLFYSLVSFYFRFPKIIPYDWDIKPVATYFKSLSSPKCLWLQDIPPESSLFYSNAGEVLLFNSEAKPFGHCKNYLMTPRGAGSAKVLFQNGNIKLVNFEN